MEYKEAFDVCLVASIVYQQSVHPSENANAINYTYLSSLLYRFFGLEYIDAESSLKPLVDIHLKEKYNSNLDQLIEAANTSKQKLFEANEVLRYSREGGLGSRQYLGGGLTGMEEHFSRHMPEVSSPLSPLSSLKKTYNAVATSSGSGGGVDPRHHDHSSGNSAIDQIFIHSNYTPTNLSAAENTSARPYDSHSNVVINVDEEEEFDDNDDEDEESRIKNNKKEWGPWYELLHGLSEVDRQRVLHYRSNFLLPKDALYDLLRLIISEPGSDIFLNPVPPATMMEVHHDRKGPYGDVVFSPVCLTSIKNQIAKSGKYYYSTQSDSETQSPITCGNLVPVTSKSDIILTLAQLETALWHISSNCVVFNAPEGSYPSTARSFVQRAVYILVQYCREQLAL